MGSANFTGRCCTADANGDKATNFVEGNEFNTPKDDPPSEEISVSRDERFKVTKEPTPEEAASSGGGRQRRPHRALTWAQQLPAKFTTITVKLVKPLGKEVVTKIGLDIDYAEENTCLPIIEVNGGLALQCNTGNSGNQMRSGDAIVAVNGISKDVAKMLRSCSTAGILELLVVRGTSEETGLDPVASALIVAEDYYQEVAGSGEIADKESLSSDKAGKEAATDALSNSRSLARKKTLNWSAVRG